MTYVDVKQYLKSLGNETIYYFPNPGNAGDSLIAHTTFQLFKENQVNYQLLNQKQEQKIDSKNKIILYGGGGNLVNNYYGDARYIVQKYHRLAKKLVILPHTINTHEDLLEELGNNVDIICREEVSYNHCKKYAPRANIMIANDLAFNLNLEDTFTNKPIALIQSIALKTAYKLTKNANKNLTIPSPRRMIVNRFLEIQQSINENHVLNCFRIDSEKTNIKIPNNNLDLSLLLQYGTSSEEVAFYASYRLLSFISRYEEIKTNRLHLAIAAALLKKRVKFYANSYYKCKAVYEYSMKDRFPNVTWMG